MTPCLKYAHVGLPSHVLCQCVRVKSRSEPWCHHQQHTPICHSLVPLSPYSSHSHIPGHGFQEHSLGGMEFFYNLQYLILIYRGSLKNLHLNPFLVGLLCFILKNNVTNKEKMACRCQYDIHLIGIGLIKCNSKDNSFKG